ncbi:MAG: Gfo/Idh/MocA family oxidoreductase [Clostridia bacterium]|nr:Gfo/Idh/MocA family oxidoreductase [Clostridia bacterium]
MKKIAFAGLAHGHMFDLAEMAALRPDIEIAGAYEGRRPLKCAAETGFFPKRYPTYEDLLSDGTVDIVAIGDCYGLRGSMAIDALRAGKHVLCDKPLCTEVAELDTIARLCEAKGLKAGCMLTLRDDAAFRLCRDYVRKGAIGEIKNVCFTGQHPLNYGTRPAWYFEEGMHGGVFNDIAVHGIDAVMLISGLECKAALCARQWNSYAQKAPCFLDCAQMLLRLSNGAGLIADVSYSAPSKPAFRLPTYWRFSFWGESGFIEFRIGDGEIVFASEKEESPRRIEAQPPGDDFLTRFLAETEGIDTQYGTQSVLKATRAALEIQSAADKMSRNGKMEGEI